MAAYQPAAKSDSQRVKWKIHWIPPAIMVSLLIAGIAFAVGHHFFYQSLDDTLVTSSSQQKWTIRIGTGMAFLVKATLAAAVGVAFTQYLWMIARRKAMAVGSLDSMFSLTSNPLSFANLEVLFKAKLLVLLALASWFMPLIAIVTPGTISVENRMVTNTTNGRVPFVAFSRSEDVWSDYVGESGSFGTVGSASPAVTRLLSAVASSMGIIPITPQFANSSFTLHFHGPALKCESLADAKNNDQPVGDCRNCTSLQRLWNSTMKNSNAAQYIYWQSAAPEDSHNLLFIRTGTGVHVGGTPRYNSCQLWNASYTAQFNFTDGAQTTTIKDLKYESTMNYTSSTSFGELPPGGRAYLSMFQAISTLLFGEVGITQGLSSSGMLGADLPIVGTGLMACPEILADWKYDDKGTTLDQIVSPWMCRKNSVPAAVEDLFQNFTLSLLSSQFLNGNTSTDIYVSFPRNFWSYNPLDLLISYVVGVVVALVAIIVGFWALFLNGYSAGSSFSTILLTTRNPNLDDIAAGQCLGSQPLDRNFQKMKLQFGIVGRKDGVDHAAFGIRGTVNKLRKGQECS
ncbi:uncharacterized protein K452DRAFT_275818 [Aplosporella prunicola CBS 121167]|uniref:Uncharacterized protein n=1 Tax=Aplosporella prunicola CBS 121167 TaxID=1176127 RepID=A0A6A6B6Q5_9PEZI|nr:uncharacterized protein K452DRAFT_275818 [Aplosporella prunicola CBS 121167]KAF2138914.1 hypothetical protein K452DRAFT_275818 [Aplosporella prunicola CBS 121167]